jgi:hypothetical protein
MTNERHIFCELAISSTEAGAFEHTVSARGLAQAGIASQRVRQRERFLISEGNQGISNREEVSKDGSCVAVWPAGPFELTGRSLAVFREVSGG